MTAMTGPRFVSERTGTASALPAAAGALIWQGAIVVNDGGVAKPGATALSLVVLGLARETIDNTAGAAGARTVVAERGVYRLFNLGADAVTAAEVGKDCYLVDDQTVARTSGTNTRSIAGTVIEVDGAGVWVRLGL